MKMKKLITIIIAFFVMTLAFSNVDNYKSNYTPEEVEFIQSLIDQGYTILPEVTICPITQDTILHRRMVRQDNRPMKGRMMSSDTTYRKHQHRPSDRPMMSYNQPNRPQMINQRQQMINQRQQMMNQRQQMMNQRQPVQRQQMMNQRPMKKMEQKKIQQRKRDIEVCENPNPQPIRKMEQKKLQKRFEK